MDQHERADVGPPLFFEVRVEEHPFVREFFHPARNHRFTLPKVCGTSMVNIPRGSGPVPPPVLIDMLRRVNTLKTRGELRDTRSEAVAQVRRETPFPDPPQLVSSSRSPLSRSLVHGAGRKGQGLIVVSAPGPPRRPTAGSSPNKISPLQSFSVKTWAGRPKNAFCWENDIPGWRRRRDPGGGRALGLPSRLTETGPKLSPSELH